MRSRTASSISRAESGRPAGSAERETTGFFVASGGKSHSSVTASSSSPRPKANTISVAEGRSETIFTGSLGDASSGEASELEGALQESGQVAQGPPRLGAVEQPV